MLLGESVNDFDMYLRTKEATVAVANYYVERFRANPPPHFHGTKEQFYVKVEDDGEEEYEAKVLGSDPDNPQYETKTRTLPGRVSIFIRSAGIAGENANVSDDAMDAAEYVDHAVEGAQDIDDADKDKPRYRPVFLSSNAITLSNKVQVVIRFYGEPESIHQNFDFLHAMSYWTSWDNKLVLPAATLECLLSRTLIYCGSRYPVCSIFRVRKFLERGWRITAGQLLKIQMQVSMLDLEDIDVLEDQLLGVDTYYMMQIIEILRERFPEGRVPPAYLLALIDKFF